MKEENKGASKNKGSSIFRKKWFFPALYLAIAALLLSVVVWYQNLDNQIPKASDKQGAENYTPNPYDEDAEAVLEQQEIIKMPVKDQDQAEIVTKFYDYNAEQEDKENALVLYNNRFYQSTGIDIASADGEPFEVVASLSGTVTEVKEDPLLGNVVIMSHDNDVMTYYASLGDVEVKAGAKVKQGETLGTAGKSLFGKDSGTHVHFELRKDGKEVNPEAFFNQPVSKLDGTEAEDVTEDQAEDQAKEQAEDQAEDKADDDSTKKSDEDAENPADSKEKQEDTDKNQEQDKD